MLIPSTRIDFCRLQRNRLYLSKIKFITDHLENQADIATVVSIMSKIEPGQEATIPSKTCLSGTNIMMINIMKIRKRFPAMTPAERLIAACELSDFCRDRGLFKESGKSELEIEEIVELAMMVEDEEHDK